MKESSPICVLHKRGQWEVLKMKGFSQGLELGGQTSDGGCAAEAKEVAGFHVYRFRKMLVAVHPPTQA